MKRYNIKLKGLFTLLICVLFVLCIFPPAVFASGLPASEITILYAAEGGDEKDFIEATEKHRKELIEIFKKRLLKFPEETYSREQLEYYSKLNYVTFTNYLTGEPVLHYAARGGNIKMIKYLLDNGAGIDQTDNGGMTPLMMAAMYGRLEAFKYLIKKGANINIKDKSGFAPMHFAAFFRHINVLNYLISRGCNIEVKDSGGQTPLYKAVRSGQYKIVDFLISKGAEVKVKDYYGVTPLHSAVYLKRNQIILILLKHGAEINVRDNECFAVEKFFSYHATRRPHHVKPTSGDPKSIPTSPLELAFNGKDSKTTTILLKNGAVFGINDIVRLVKDKNREMIELIIINSSYLHYRIILPTVLLVIFIYVFTSRFFRKKDNSKNV